MRSLLLTTPWMRGQDVVHAQNTLVKNVFATNYLQDVVDGVFGPSSARACVRAKYWLGYKPTEQDPTYGQVLDNFLTGETKLPTANVRLRNARIKAGKETPLRVKALTRACKDLGMKESPPNSNQCPITRKWGFTGPWCGMAVSIWYLDVGSKAFKLGSDYGYVPWLVQAASQGRNGIAITTTPLPGDLVPFDWDGNGVSDHVGMRGDAELFQKLAPNAFAEAIRQQGRPSSDEFWTIEGNTGFGNDSDGGEVMIRKRAYASVTRWQGRRAFVHVGK